MQRGWLHPWSKRGWPPAFRSWGPFRALTGGRGKSRRQEEWLCILKTRRSLFKKLETEIRAMHPYEVPEIVAVPVVEGSKDYLGWIDGETGL